MITSFIIHYRETLKSSDAKLLEADKDTMIDNASKLATQLAALSPQHLIVSRAIFSNEDHVSVSLASLGRALTFALKP
jgi:hypothetical protein